MTTAAEYRAEAERIRSTVMTEAANYGLDSERLNTLAEALGVTVEDEETRQAREELEALQLTVQKATRTFLPRGQRDAALRRLGVPVPQGRVGRL